MATETLNANSQCATFFNMLFQIDMSLIVYTAREFNGHTNIMDSQIGVLLICPETKLEC